MSDNAGLLAAADAVDVIETAGRIIANPRRNAIAASAAEVLALAYATERFWAIALEADLLVRAMRLPADDAAAFAIERQAAQIETLMAAIRGEPKETKHDA
jgi:hypothetical protein